MKTTIGANEFDTLTTVEKADRHLSGDVTRAALWALRQPEAKARAVVSATRQMLALPWCGTAPDATLAAQPAVIEEVTAELAADLLAKPRLFANASGDSNIKVAKAGSAQVEFFAPVRGGPPLPRALWDRLMAAGLMCLGTDSDSALDGPYVSGASDGCRPYEGRYARGWPTAERDYD